MGCAGLQPQACLIAEQAKQLAELHQALLERRSVDIALVDSSKWEQLRAFANLEVLVRDKPIQPRHALKKETEVSHFK